MDTTQLHGLIGMVAVLGILALLVLPSALGIAHDRRVDRRIREAQEALGGARPAAGPRRRDQKSSSRSTVPSTATWYAEGRRSKKFVSS
ncbi:hypothetical protein [Streptomyces tropicalis]|uniref:Secreted protein n=1 Tax=Streptomyces tropicalis TaxID=3034234 RepID=A0ABT6A2D7_9ACTN|nr:hypothetical protein [Streptomyces tropicalis]MDF3297965.1 hypothetical protein [Streptomyces tropicalis]